MNTGKAPEEKSIPRHRIVYPRSDHGYDIQRAKNRNSDNGGNPRRCLVAEESRGRHLGHSQRPFHLGHWHTVDVNYIDRQVESDHKHISEQQSARKISLRIFDLAGDIDHRVPSRISKNRRYECRRKNAEIGDFLPIEQWAEMRRVSFAE